MALKDTSIFKYEVQGDPTLYEIRWSNATMIIHLLTDHADSVETVAARYKLTEAQVLRIFEVLRR